MESPLSSDHTVLQKEEGYPTDPCSFGTLVQVKKSAFDSTMVRIYKEEGLGGLYAGLSSSLYGIAITNGVYCEYDTVYSHLPLMQGDGPVID